MTDIELRCAICGTTSLGDARPAVGLHLHEVREHGKPTRGPELRNVPSPWKPATGNKTEVDLWDYIDRLRDEAVRLRALNERAAL